MTGSSSHLQIERLEQRQHPLGIVESPAHVGVGHDVDAVADRFAHGANQVEIALHAGGAVHRSPAKTQLHRLVAFLLVAFRFGLEFAQLDAVQAAGVNRNARLRPASEQPIDGLFGRFAQNVPQRDVNRADRDHADSLAAESHGLAIHVLPEEFDVPRIASDQQRLEIKIDHLFRDLGRQRGIADPDQAIVGEDFDHQPAMEGEGLHGSFGELQQVHGIGAKVGRQRDGLSTPAHYAGTNFFNFHRKFSSSSEITQFSFHEPQTVLQESWPE